MKMSDMLLSILANISTYWTRSSHSCPIYLFIGHVALILGRYIHLSDTLLRILANIPIYWTRCFESWPIYPLTLNNHIYAIPISICLSPSFSYHLCSFSALSTIFLDIKKPRKPICLRGLSISSILVFFFNIW